MSNEPKRGMHWGRSWLRTRWGVLQWETYRARRPSLQCCVDKGRRQRYFEKLNRDDLAARRSGDVGAYIQRSGIAQSTAACSDANVALFPRVVSILPSSHGSNTLSSPCQNALVSTVSLKRPISDSIVVLTGSFDSVLGQQVEKKWAFT